MIGWTPQTSFSTKRLWLRKIRTSFHLYRRLLFVLVFILSSSFLTGLSLSDSPVVVVMRGGILSVLRPVIQGIRSPLDWAREGKEWLASWVLLQRRHSALITENETLKEKAVLLESVRQENEELRKLLNAPRVPKIPFITAEVLAYPGRPYAKNLLLKGGEELGIKPFQVVVHEKGLVGRVLHVTHGNTHVVLITDVNSHIPVAINGSEAQGILVGRNDRLPYIRSMDPEGINVGDLVETSGKGGIFPPRIPVGTVVSIDGQDVVVRPLCPLERLSHVLLMGPVIHSVVEQLVHHATPRSS